MNARDYWELFLDTGAPEAYLLYHKAMRMETEDVSDHPGTGSARIGLQ